MLLLISSFSLAGTRKKLSWLSSFVERKTQKQKPKAMPDKDFFLQVDDRKAMINQNIAHHSECVRRINYSESLFQIISFDSLWTGRYPSLAMLKAKIPIGFIAALRAFIFMRSWTFSL